MIAKILSKIGIPILIKYLSQSLTSIDSDVAKKASSALFEVDSAISQQQISLEELKEANRHAEKTAELEADLDEKTLGYIHQTIRQEMNANDRFIRFWRPAFGYSVALAWLMNMFTICYVVISNNQHATEIIMALADTTSLWGIALGVLGISVVKGGQDKPLPNQDIFKKIIHKL